MMNEHAWVVRGLCNSTEAATQAAILRVIRQLVSLLQMVELLAGPTASWLRPSQPSHAGLVFVWAVWGKLPPATALAKLTADAGF